MNLLGVLRSESQRRAFLLGTTLLLLLLVAATLTLAHAMPATAVWNAVIGLLTSALASGIFAIIATLYLSYFFRDLDDLAQTTVVLPADIGNVLQQIARTATNYKIFVRTGRHFRADILPLLLEHARQARLCVQVEVVLLDPRDDTVCGRYAAYRKSSSFDSRLWNVQYVQSEILATVLKLLEASRNHPQILDIRLYLSKRLSNFRIEGSSDDIVVTREDPKDTAARYRPAHPSFGGYVTEFAFIRDEAEHMSASGLADATLQSIFPVNPELSKLVATARKLAHNPSPYAR